MQLLSASLTQARAGALRTAAMLRRCSRHYWSLFEY